MMERCIKVFVDGLPSTTLEVAIYVTRALKYLDVKRVQIGADVYINPEWAKDDDGKKMERQENVTRAQELAAPIEDCSDSTD